MRIKTSELAGVALDWAVAQCEGYSRGQAEDIIYCDSEALAYSTNWAQAGPIIEREKIATWWATHYIDDEGNEYGNHWYAERDDHCATGDTLLAAAMRCYVASKMGDEIDVPDTLCL